MNPSFEPILHAPRTRIILCADEDAIPHVLRTILGGYSEGVEQEYRSLRRYAQ